ncbi:MAG: type II secretion system GspH family protein [Patescibacteria group bacterium]|nr:type II secretion system GspH family protein [Patescibacteria group bacterium]
MKKSFSLIEILVFMTILSIFFIGALSVSVFYLKTLKKEQYKILATHFLEESSEWIKSEKESDWNNFSSFSSSKGTVYCLENLSFKNINNCSGYNLGNPKIFKREITLKSLDSPTTKIEATINVFWIEGNGENKVSSKLILAINE